MELNFPHKNLCVHELLCYAKSAKIKEFSDWKTGTGLHVVGFWEQGIEIVNLSLANFENEIQQVIHATNKESMDQYFVELNKASGFIEFEFHKKTILARVNEWNAKSPVAFSEKIKESENKYFESEDRKRKHLEEYIAQNNFAHFILKQPGRGNRSAIITIARKNNWNL